MSVVQESNVITISGKIDLQQLTDLLEESSVKACIDLGGTLVYQVKHPVRGNLILVNTAESDHAVIQC